MESHKCIDFACSAEIEEKAKKLGAVFWAFNLPIQIWRESKVVLLYEPRKEKLEQITFSELFEGVPGGASEENIRDLCDVTAEIFENLAKQFRAFGKNEKDVVYYPNDEK